MVRFIKHIAFAVSITCLFAFIYSCGSDNGCEGNKSSIPLAGLYSSQTKSAISVDSLTVFGIGMPGDTTIVDTATVSQVYMPLDMNDTISRFVFRYEQASIASYNITDTITLTYESTPYFHSEDCGAMYVYDIHEYHSTQNLIDSIRIPNLHIDNTNTENIQIFFRTQQEGNQ